MKLSKAQLMEANARHEKEVNHMLLKVQIFQFGQLKLEFLDNKENGIIDEDLRIRADHKTAQLVGRGEMETGYYELRTVATTDGRLLDAEDLIA